MSIALILQILFMYQDGDLYKFLPRAANHIIVAIYVGICVYAFIHFYREFEEIAIWRQGSYTTQDYVVGLLMFLLVMELSRLAHPVLFWTNIVLIFYTLWGYLSPIDFFWHPGTTFYRVVTSIDGRALDRHLRHLRPACADPDRRLPADRRRRQRLRRAARDDQRDADHRRPLAADGAADGRARLERDRHDLAARGSANAAVVGTITIPLMMRYGVPPAFAAAVETAASMGGLIMPPMMGVGAFLMSEFLGVPYWDVVLRGFALAFVYYVSVGTAVYLLCVRLLPRDAIEAPKVPPYDKIKTSIFFSTVLFLLYLMGFVGMGELRAAVYTSGLMLSLLIAVFLYFKYVLKDPEVAKETLFGNLRRSIETHAEMTSYLTLLLATLGIMIGLFTVTGFINRMGSMLLDLGAWNVVAMIFMAYIFGWLAGAGLPPTATYIIGAVVIVRPLQELGINPWIAHFFVFLLSVWGELSPPTSLTAAVSARIANASFLRTMWEALKICAADHPDDVRDLHPAQHGGEPGLAADRRYHAGADLDLRHHLRDVRTLSRPEGCRHRATLPAGGCVAVLHVPSRHDDVRDGRRPGGAGLRGRRVAAPA